RGLVFPLLAFALRPLGDVEPAVLVERVFRSSLRAADEVAARLVALLHDDLRVAVLALVRQRLVPARPVAVGVAHAAPEGLAPARPLLRYFSDPALRAREAGDRRRLRVLAGRVVAAGDEGAEAALALDQLLSAVRTRLARGFRLCPCFLVQRLRVPALGVARAAEEAAVAVPADDHRPAALGAVDLLVAGYDLADDL